MALLNYTTSVPVMRTIGEVQSILVQAGARQIMTEYNELGQPIGIAFAVETGYGLRRFTVPVNAERVHTVLSRDKSLKPAQKRPEQAERVAWRIVKDWLEAQLAIIATEMVTLDQVMLPYMTGDDGVSVYELYRDQQLALEAGPVDVR